MIPVADKCFFHVREKVKQNPFETPRIFEESIRASSQLIGSPDKRVLLNKIRN
jgi:hypothetical protein